MSRASPRDSTLTTTEPEPKPSLTLTGAAELIMVAGELILRIDCPATAENWLTNKNPTHPSPLADILVAESIEVRVTALEGLTPCPRP